MAWVLNLVLPGDVNKAMRCGARGAKAIDVEAKSSPIFYGLRIMPPKASIILVVLNNRKKLKTGFKIFYCC